MASSLTASGKLKPTCFIKNWKTLPPSPQPKHLKICISGLTVKEGVFSGWKGHKPTKRPPRWVRLT